MQKIVFIDFFGVIAKESMFASNVLFPILEPEMSYNLFKKKYLAYAFGVIQSEEFWEGVTDDTRSQADNSIDRIELNNDVIEFLQTQHAAGVTLIIASEAPRAWIERVLTNNHISQIFEDMLVSSDLHTTKPFEAFYEAMLKKADTAKAYFLDDSIENIEVATRKYKMSSFQYPDEFKMLGEELSGA